MKFKGVELVFDQDRDLGDENDAQELAGAYRRYSYGDRSCGPNTALIGGATLNEWTGTMDYQPTEMYLVTENGVQLVKL